MKNHAPVVLITGCSTGIVKALAEILHGHQYRVYVTARKVKDLSALK